jgi:hypothetical protein
MPNRSFNRAKGLGPPVRGGTLHTVQTAPLPTAGSGLMASAASETCCLLVMEAGSRWPTWLEAPPEGRVVAQDADESPTDFASRVVQAIRKVRSAGHEIDTVAISAGWGHDEQQVLFARSLITQAAARAMGGRGGAVVLSGHDRLPEELRHELFATAGALAQLLVGTPIDVVVRLDTEPNPRPTSGVFAPVSVSADLEPARTTRTGSEALTLS